MRKIATFLIFLLMILIVLMIAGCDDQFVNPVIIEECYTCHTQAANVWFMFKKRHEVIYLDKYEEVCDDIVKHINTYTYYDKYRWVKTECYKKEK